MIKLTFKHLNNLYKYSKLKQEEFINTMNQKFKVFPKGFSNYSERVKEGIIGLNHNINKIDEKYASYIVEKLINKKTLCSSIFFYLTLLIENWFENDGMLCDDSLVPFIEKYENEDRFKYCQDLIFDIEMEKRKHGESNKYSKLPDIEDDIYEGIEWFLINKDYTGFDKKYWNWCEVSKDIFKDNYKGIIDDIFKEEWKCEWYNAPIRL